MKMNVFLAEKLKEQRGASMLFTVLMMPIFLLGVFLAVTAGHAGVMYAKMYKAADAAAISGMTTIRERMRTNTFFLKDPRTGLNVRINGQEVESPESERQYNAVTLEYAKKNLGTDKVVKASDESDATVEGLLEAGNEYVLIRSRGWQNIETVPTGRVIIKTDQWGRKFQVQEMKTIQKKDGYTYNSQALALQGRVPFAGNPFMKLLFKKWEDVYVNLYVSSRAGFTYNLEEAPARDKSKVGHRVPMGIVIPENADPFYRPREKQKFTFTLRPTDIGTTHEHDAVGPHKGEKNPIIGMTPLYYKTGDFASYTEPIDYDMYNLTRSGTRAYGSEQKRTSFESRMTNARYGGNSELWEKYKTGLKGSNGTEAYAIEPKGNPISLDVDIMHTDTYASDSVTSVERARANMAARLHPHMRDAIKEAYQWRIDEAKRMKAAGTLTEKNDPRVIVFRVYEAKSRSTLAPHKDEKIFQALGRPSAFRGTDMLAGASGKTNPLVGVGTVTDYNVKYMAFRVESVDNGSYLGHVSWNPYNHKIEGAARIIDYNAGLVQPGPDGGIYMMFDQRGNSVEGPEFKLEHPSMYNKYVQIDATGYPYTTLLERASINTNFYNYFFLMYNLEIHGEFIDVKNETPPGKDPEDGSAYNYGEGDGAEDTPSWGEIRLLRPFSKEEAAEIKRKYSYMEAKDIDPDRPDRP